jgi:hypothetical protein
MAALIYALGAGISSLPYHPPSATMPQAGLTSAERTDIPILPTVVVRPDDALAALLPEVTLPTVTVRPSEADVAAAHTVDERSLGTGAVVVALHAFGGGVTGLDMPYYSFGKSVYRLRKE